MSKPNYPTFKNARVTSPFGFRTHPISKQKIFHFGIDLAPRIAGTKGVPIYAVRDGVVTERFFHNARGNTLRIKHTDENISTGYQHLDLMKNDGMIVNVGDKVKQGQRIGTMGTTGGSTGIHLHFEVLKGKTFTQKQPDYLDPQDYLNKDTHKGGKIMLNVDGHLGEKTIKRLQEFLGSKIKDGKISKPSNMVKDLQEFLNKYGR